MLRYLIDPANAITVLGLTCAVSGIYALLCGRLELGLAIVLWALLADHLDGMVAKRTRNRSPDKAKIGKQLDSFTDLVSDVVFPIILVVQLNHPQPVVLALAVLLLIAGALRLSYFNSFGLSEGRFVGVPLSYDLPVLALLFLMRPALPPASFAAVVDVTLLALAALHVSTVRVPRTRGALLAGIAAFSVTASWVLAVRGAM
jgi:CDP-diacylglycerol--serine O-phosphatidyltransferase